MNSYSTLWTSISFYVPQDTKAAKAAARKFIRTVKSLGNDRVVISKGRGAGLICCKYSKACEVLAAVLPEDAELRLVPVTDKQIEKSAVLWGKARKFATTGGVATN